MPRDQRLYMTFPIDFPDHPKVKPLNVAAKWAFVEMNAYSRRQGLDGVIPIQTARAIWSRKVLADLVASHPTRPLLVLDGNDYLIRDYADHQLTTGDIDDLREKRASAGAKGGKAKATRQQPASKPLASAIAKGKQTLAESESRSEIEKDLTDIGNEPQSSPVVDARTEGLDGFNEIVIQKAQRAGIRDIRKLYPLIARTVQGPLTAPAAVELAQVIAERSTRPVNDVDAYVATACRKTPEDVQHWYDTCDLGVA